MSTVIPPIIEERPPSDSSARSTFNDRRRALRSCDRAIEALDNGAFAGLEEGKRRALRAKFERYRARLLAGTTTGRRTRSS